MEKYTFFNDVDDDRIYFAEDFARNNHIPNLFSEVSFTARPFFEKRGFIVEQEQLVKVNNVEMDNFRMRKSLYI